MARTRATLPWEDMVQPGKAHRAQAPPLARPLPAGAVQFFVAGLPQPKGSARGFAMPVKGQVDRHGKPRYRAVITTDNVRLKAWERTVEAEAMIAAKGCSFGAAPVVVRLAFRLERPRSVPASKRPLPVVPPDVDKLARGAIDALHPTLFNDDCQVVAVRATKDYALPQGVLVTVMAAAPGVSAEAQA